MTTMPRKRNTAKIIAWIILAILLLAILSVGVLFLIHILRITSSPSIEIIAPAEGRSAPALTPLTVQAAAMQRRVPVSRLDFYADGVLRGSISGEKDALMGSWNWNPPAAGNHTLAFVATNSKGTMNLVKRDISITAVADADGDGIADIADACPDVFGYAASNGCLDETDTDADGLTGDADACPETPGSTADGGCLPESRPDADRDGILDMADLCPETSGLADFRGCPVDAWFSDRDGDSVPDFLDHCADEAGPGDSSGCPAVETGDADGDGVPDAEDACPLEPGSTGTSGCPLTEDEDGDGDGVADDSDSCPEEAGAGIDAGCRPEDWVADADLDLVPDLFDREPDLPGLLDRLGIPIPGDEDGDGAPDETDCCPGYGGPPEDDGCPRFFLPEDMIWSQNLFTAYFPFLPLGHEEEVHRSVEEVYYNDRDRDGVEDSMDVCMEYSGDPSTGGCACEDDTDCDGIRDGSDRCDDIPGLYWGEYTDTYMLGCPRVPPGEVNLELEITAIKISSEMEAAYCYVLPRYLLVDIQPGSLMRVPPAYRHYQVVEIPYAFSLDLSEYYPRVTSSYFGYSISEEEDVQLFAACWGQPEGISLPAQYLGEIYRIHSVEDWDSIIRYAGGVGDRASIGVYYRICRDHCPRP